MPMKNLTIFICTMLTAYSSYAQIKHQFSAETSTGYEYNIFKSPRTFIDMGTPVFKDSLYKNSIFQEIGFKYTAKKEWGKQQLSLRVNPIGQYYYSTSESSYFTLFSGLRYQYKFSKKTNWHIATRFNIKDREGENIDGSELNFPLGYRHFDVDTGLNFRIYKPNRSYVRLLYGNRKYHETEQSQLAYNIIGGQGVFRNVFKRNTGWHSYGVQLNYSIKYFDRNLLLTGTKDSFNWKEFSLGTFYRFPLTKTLDITPNVQYKKRADSNKDKFSYTQWKPSLLMAYKTKKTRLELTASYINRKYNTLQATNTAGTNLGVLQYRYYQLRLNGEYKLNKKLSLLINGYINNRQSNKTNENSIYFRGYDYFNTSVGVRYTF